MCLTEFSAPCWIGLVVHLYLLTYHSSLHVLNALPCALQRLSSLYETEAEVLEYQPHPYADEGDAGTISDMENISIPDDHLFQNALTDLGPEFQNLASICKPTH